MEALANLLVATMDLFEAEGRALHRGLIRFLVRAAAIVGAAVLGVMGLSLLATGIYLGLAHWLGHAGATLVSGFFLVAAAGGLFMYGRITPQRPPEGTVHTLEEKVPDEEIATAPDMAARTEEGNKDDKAFATAQN